MKLHARFGSASRAARVVPFASVALLVAIMFPTAASATNLTVAVSKTAWFWSSNRKVTTCTSDGTQDACVNASIAGGAFGNSAGASPITQGHVGIGVKDGASDMRGYVKFNLEDIPYGATINSMVARFTISKPDQQHAEQHAGATGAKVPATFNEAQALIQVCAVAEPWGAAEGDPPSSTTVVRPKPDQPGGNTQPETTVQQAEPDPPDCSLSTSAVFSPDGKTLTANLTTIAAAWASGARINEGIALLPIVQGTKPNWTVELHGASTTVSSDTGTITFVNKTEAASAAVAFSAPVAPPPPPPTVIDDGPTFPSFGNPIPVDPGPQVPVDFGAGVPPPPAAPSAFVPVGEATGDTPAWFYGLFPLGLLVMGFVSGLIGADTTSAPTVGADSRVAAVLRARRLDR